MKTVGIICLLLFSLASLACYADPASVEKGGTLGKADLKFRIRRYINAADGSPIGKSFGETVYLSGAKLRDDSQLAIGISDLDADKDIWISPEKRVYSSYRYSDEMGSELKAEAQNKVSMTDTGETATILGHVCRHYVIKSQEASGPTGVIRYDILATDDFGKMSGYLFGIVFGLGVHETALLHRFPLKVTRTKITGDHQTVEVIGDHITIEVVSVSTDKLPPSTFQVPSGYKLDKN